MTNIFESAKDTEAQLQFAMLNPITAEGLELNALQRQTKIDLLLCFVLIFLIALAIYKDKNKKILTTLWIFLVIGAVSFGMHRKNELDELQHKAKVAHEEAVEKAMKKINDEAFKKLKDKSKPLQIENKQLITSEEIRELMPKASTTKSIDMNCSSVSASSATCSGTITKK